MCLPSPSTRSNLVSSLKNSLDLSYISCFIPLPTGSFFTWSSQGHGNVAAWNVLPGNRSELHCSKSLWKWAKWLKWKNKSLVSGCCASEEKKQTVLKQWSWGFSLLRNLSDTVVAQRCRVSAQFELVLLSPLASYFQPQWHQRSCRLTSKAADGTVRMEITTCSTCTDVSYRQFASHQNWPFLWPCMYGIAPRLNTVRTPTGQHLVF